MNLRGFGSLGDGTPCDKWGPIAYGVARAAKKRGLISGGPCLAFGSLSADDSYEEMCPVGTRGGGVNEPLCVPIAATSMPAATDPSAAPTNIIGGFVDWIADTGKSVVAAVSPKPAGPSAPGMSTGKKVAIVGGLVALYFLIGRK